MWSQALEKEKEQQQLSPTNTPHNRRRMLRNNNNNSNNITKCITDDNEDDDLSSMDRGSFNNNKRAWTADETRGANINRRVGHDQRGGNGGGVGDSTRHIVAFERNGSAAGTPQMRARTAGTLSSLQRNESDDLVLKLPHNSYRQTQRKTYTTVPTSLQFHTSYRTVL
jgi:hypothetical protein